MNPESVDYDNGSDEVFIKFTDDSGNEILELILFKEEAWQLCKMIQERLRYKKRV